MYVTWTGQRQSIKVGNKSFEDVAKFKTVFMKRLRAD
jgi:hypothetical protein